MKKNQGSSCGILSGGLGPLIREAHVNARGEIEVLARPANLSKVLSFLQAHPECGFSRFVGIFVDSRKTEGAVDGFSLSYLLRGDDEKNFCRIRVMVDAGDILPSSSRVVPGALWSERLAWDFFGIPFSGHPDLRNALHSRIEVGPAGNRGENVLVIGPKHKGMGFSVLLQLHLEGEVVRRLVVHPGGSLPRMECTLEDVMPIGHAAGGGQSGFFVRLACARAVESLACVKLSVPVCRRRVMLSEMARILAHLRAIAEMNEILEQSKAAELARNARDKLLPVFLRHQAGVVAGGVSTAFLDEDREALLDFCQRFSDIPERLEQVSPFLRLRMAGIGVLSGNEAMEMGCSGPVLRAAGIMHDLRQEDADYAGLPMEIVCGRSGDSQSRHLVRAAELDVSLKIVQACLSGMDGEEPASLEDLPEKFPEGEVYEAVESAQGEVGAHVFSRGGEGSGLVLRLRIPTGFHLSALPALVEGHMVDDVGVIMASLGLGGSGSQP